MVLADDGNYKLKFVKRGSHYRAGCRDFSREEAIRHWSFREKGLCPCGCSREDRFTSTAIRDRAKLFLKAIKAHAKAEGR